MRVFLYKICTAVFLMNTTSIFTLLFILGKKREVYLNQESFSSLALLVVFIRINTLMKLVIIRDQKSAFDVFCCFRTGTWAFFFFFWLTNYYSFELLKFTIKQLENEIHFAWHRIDTTLASRLSMSKYSSTRGTS